MFGSGRTYVFVLTLLVFVDARSQRDLNLDGGLFDIEDVLDDQNKEKQTTTSKTSTLESNQKPVAILDFGCKGSIFRMNIFSSELALLLSIIGMILSFCVNLIQCYGRKFSRANTDTEELPMNQTRNSDENSTQEQTIFLRPQPQSLMESTSYEAYFPERRKYETSFSSLLNSDSKKGFEKYRRENPVTFTGQMKNAGKTVLNSDFSKMSIKEFKEK